MGVTLWGPLRHENPLRLADAACEEKKMGETQSENGCRNHNPHKTDVRWVTQSMGECSAMLGNHSSAGGNKKRA